MKCARNYKREEEEEMGNFPEISIVKTGQMRGKAVRSVWLGMRTKTGKSDVTGMIEDGNIDVTR
uniref:Uncharacterized protein n=1 Tax=Pristionchus pacificus TaxID=54126 RepID=A0A2A6CY28_PRIPA|eukprot:PDM83124.1 hypothetical protein PRIPAC_37517 [Pristionchus pacificus]